MLNVQTLDNKETQDQLSATADTIVEQNLIPEAKEIARCPSSPAKSSIPKILCSR